MTGMLKGGNKPPTSIRFRPTLEANNLYKTLTHLRKQFNRSNRDISIGDIVRTPEGLRGEYQGISVSISQPRQIYVKLYKLDKLSPKTPASEAKAVNLDGLGDVKISYSLLPRPNFPRKEELIEQITRPRGQYR